MIRAVSVVLALAAACGTSKSEDKPVAPATGDRVQVPGGGGTASKGGVVGGAQAPVDDPKKHIQPDEGTLEVGKAEGKVGAEAVAMIKVTPAAGYHVSTEFPTELALDAPPAGVKLAKALYGK